MKRNKVAPVSAVDNTIIHVVAPGEENIERNFSSDMKNKQLALNPDDVQSSISLGEYTDIKEFRIRDRAIADKSNDLCNQLHREQVLDDAIKNKILVQCFGSTDDICFGPSIEPNQDKLDN